MSDLSEHRRRRQELEIQLSALSEQREHAFRANSDALALQRAGVTHHDGAEMKQFSDAELAGASAMTNLRREIALIDNELERRHGIGLAARGRTVMRWLRR
jgi:hypothetical protein